jgi:shikimate kinase/3-dehydroquinate synthase
VEALSAFVFVGFMGAGKSTAARIAAAELGVEPLDSDREVERTLGESIESYFDREGEASFRAREEEVVLGLLERPDARVIALGGGALGSDRIRDALSGHTVVHLQIGAEEAWRRASGKGRPLARDRGRFDQLKQDREAVYAAVASAWLPPMPRNGVRRAIRPLEALEQAPAGTRLAWAGAASGDYPVFFGRGLVRSGFFYPSDGKRFVVTDEHVVQVLPLEGEATHVFPPGEQEKTLARAETVLRFLAEQGASGDDVVVAVGGGVAGDLTGSLTPQRSKRSPTQRRPPATPRS